MTVSEFHAEVPQAIVSEGLAKGSLSYVAYRAGFEPATLWTKGVESTIEPPRLAMIGLCVYSTSFERQNDISSDVDQ